MIPFDEWLFYSSIATALHCILYWHVYPSGDFIPFLQPVDDRTWRQLVQ